MKLSMPVRYCPGKSRDQLFATHVSGPYLIERYVIVSTNNSVKRSTHFLLFASRDHRNEEQSNEERKNLVLEVN